MRTCRSLVCLLLLGACDSTDDQRWIVWTQDGVRYHSREGDPFACPQAIDHIVEHRTAFAEFFGVRSAGTSDLDYYKYRDRDDYRESAGCPSGSDGCFSGPVHSPFAVHYHELIHAWTYPAMGGYTPILSEGLATALSCEPLSHNVPIEANLSLDVTEPNGPGYEHAGYLMVQALRDAAPSSLMDLVRGADASTRDESAVRDGLSRVYGKSAEELISEVASDRSPPCFALGRCDSAPLLTFGPTRLVYGCAGTSEFLLTSELGPAVGLWVSGYPVDMLACSPSAAPFALRPTGVGRNPEQPSAEYFSETPSEPHLLSIAVSDPEAEALLHLRPA
ncbi:MAG TPA: hypothetical protein VGP93_15825, partial [Polyangiaceae bacterium]|nr:hypothetical protein [Polyangiaceae bacterium]